MGFDRDKKEYTNLKSYVRRRWGARGFDEIIGTTCGVYFHEMFLGLENEKAGVISCSLVVIVCFLMIPLCWVVNESYAF